MFKKICINSAGVRLCKDSAEDCIKCVNNKDSYTVNLLSRDVVKSTKMCFSQHLLALLEIAHELCEFTYSTRLSKAKMDALRNLTLHLIDILEVLISDNCNLFKQINFYEQVEIQEGPTVEGPGQDSTVGSETNADMKVIDG